ncbi:energy-coupling factor transporter transmembrane component T [Clostridium vincentii]|uniref:Energy-coupling factor transporter transmembrane protein EcfT n=1 Tax=Clostridium vincentii TaxID=52704 RepID=A0A2T0BHM5_9CLOT|nr:energy-coupling factor transporter transmembrane component T [Clostridium vincentii]PRR83399.1 Energy-coupling factor transporter transmembrane protein EcfT [Clostridium vincentii]
MEDKKFEDSFSSYHPIINFIYFLGVISCSMFFMHPVFLGISIISAMSYSFYLKGMKAIKFNLLYMIPTLLFVALINPIFNHEGMTILLYINKNALTLEAVTYGVASGIMFISVLIWFSSYNVIMTSDKFMYIFGRIIPSTSLIISMVLRFVPRFKRQIKVISDGQKSIGKDVTNGNVFQRTNHGIRILSILTTWSLENSFETADSMKARGYGLKGRTSFSPFKFSKRDRIALIILLILIGTVIMGGVYGENSIDYFPSIIVKPIESFSIYVYTSYLILCIFPIIINIWEEIKWKLLK